MKKSRIKNIALVTALVGVLAVGSIFAFFTDKDTATNEFTVGNVSIDLTEPNWNPDNGKDLVPNQTVKKDPTITNDGVNDEYVFAKVTVPNAAVTAATKDGEVLPEANEDLFYYEVNSGWTLINTAEEEGQTVYTYVWGTADKPTALKKNAKTSAIFDSVTFINLVETGMDKYKGASTQINIKAYGIQTTGFESANSTTIFNTLLEQVNSASSGVK